jgi:D-beta-D-heptose 7-phosphate kinase/D-beta-D-heptose 1-phosphate adenosyltransferase
MSKKYAITSMYANPIHPGHVECLKLSKDIVDELWVIVNNDIQAELKRGVPSFQDEVFRMKIIESIRYVDKVILSVDNGPSVVDSIKLTHDLIKKEEPNATIIFTKGGDRFGHEIPEAQICKELNIMVVDGLGEKTHHSSKIIIK